MVRTHWVGIAFACGIVLGVVGTRMVGSTPVADESVMRDSIAQVQDPLPMPTTPAEAPRAALGSAPPVTHVVIGSAKSPAVESTSATVQSPLALPAGDGAASHKIDVGDAFHQQIDRPSAPGFPNEFGDAHRTLEQESRDDSWAYQMEADIQNSLTAFVSTGELQVRFLECRMTTCEMRLYASDAHANVLKDWQELMPSQPWMNRIQMVGLGMNSGNGGTEGLWIFRKPPKPSRAGAAH
jgi:hypothetical protein